ncbi:hypothetical protein HDU85_003583 [Gaertneriomyces sp. JEL0708]|nr:hypothetical protein HDU85_003583 [Gaertneriomyces sp. JEL0708]
MATPEPSLPRSFEDIFENTLEGLLRDQPDGTDAPTHPRFTSKLKIPAYQRSYVWGPALVTTLLQDIIDSFKKNNGELIERADSNDNPDSNGHTVVRSTRRTSNVPQVHLYGTYFLGPLVLVRSTRHQDAFDVVDGQQRLTTLMIIFALIRSLDSDPSSCDGFLRRSGYEEFYLDLPRFGHLDFGIAFRREIQESALRFQAFTGTARAPAGKAPLQIFRAQLYKNAKAAKRCLDDNKADNWRRSLGAYCFSRCTFLVTVAPGLPEAYNIFCTINKTGLKFRTLDYLKALYWGRLLEDGTQRDLNQAFDQWIRTYSRLGEDLEYLLEHVYRVNRIKASGDPQSSPLAEECQAEIQESLKTTIESANSPQHVFLTGLGSRDQGALVEFLRVLEESDSNSWQQIWKFVKEPEARAECMVDPQIARAIDMLGTLPREAPYDFWLTIFIAIGRVDPTALQNAAVWKAVERVCALALISAPLPSDQIRKRVTRILSSFILSIPDESTDVASDVVSVLNIQAERLVATSRNRILNDFCTRAPPIAVKYLLRRLNLETGGQTEWRDLLYGNIQTEHIAPRNGQKWPEEIYSQLFPFVNKLGNLTLLHGSDNSVCSNNSWPDKRAIYARNHGENSIGGFGLTRDLCRHDDWTFATFNDRHNSLTRIALETYEIPRQAPTTPPRPTSVGSSYPLPSAHGIVRSRSDEPVAEPDLHIADILTEDLEQQQAEEEEPDMNGGVIQDTEEPNHAPQPEIDEMYIADILTEDLEHQQAEEEEPDMNGGEILDTEEPSLAPQPEIDYMHITDIMRNEAEKQQAEEGQQTIMAEQLQRVEPSVAPQSDIAQLEVMETEETGNTVRCVKPVHFSTGSLFCRDCRRTQWKHDDEVTQELTQEEEVTEELAELDTLRTSDNPGVGTSDRRRIQRALDSLRLPTFQRFFQSFCNTQRMLEGDIFPGLSAAARHAQEYVKQLNDRKIASDVVRMLPADAEINAPVLSPAMADHIAANYLWRMSDTARDIFRGSPMKYSAGELLASEVPKVKHIQQEDPLEKGPAKVNSGTSHVWLQ